MLLYFSIHKSQTCHLGYNAARGLVGSSGHFCHMAPRDLSSEGYKLVSTVHMDGCSKQYWTNADGDMVGHVVVTISFCNTRELSYTEKSGEVFGFYNLSDYCGRDGLRVFYGCYTDWKQRIAVGVHVFYGRDHNGDIYIENTQHFIGDCVFSVSYTVGPRIIGIRGYHGDPCGCGPVRPRVIPKRIREEIDSLFGKRVCIGKR